MDSLEFWMPSLRKQHKDYKWVAKNIVQIQRAITFAVNRPSEQRLALEALNLLYDYIIMYGDWERWVRLWFDALRNAQSLKDSPAQTHLWRGMGGLYVLSGQHKRGRAAFMNFLERAKEKDELELILSGYIGLIRLQAISQDASFTDELIKNASDLAQQINDAKLWAQLHQALALAYNSRHETTPSLAHGQTAYCYWLSICDTIEMARVAFTLAQTCRVAELFQQAKRFLDLARSLYALTPSGARHAALDYEEGQLYLDQESYEEAKQWLEYVKLEFSTLNQPYYHAAAVHSLGLAYGYLGEYEASHNHFEEALKIWRELENVYEQAHLYYGWAEMEKRHGNSVKCLEYLYEGLKLCEELPCTPARIKMERGMDEMMDGISKPSYS